MNASDVTAVVFPGQGTQRRGMAEDFFDAYDVARDTFAEVSERLGLDMAALCFEDDDRLPLTEFAQPAILTAEIAMFRVLQSEFDFHPAWFGGHSLGEYAALVAAGVIAVADAAELVRRRGRLMQEAVPVGSGAMSAIVQPDMDLNALRAALEGGAVDIANINSPAQAVISGGAEAVAAAAASVRTVAGFERARAIALKVSAPFHSRLMQPAETAFAPLLEDASTRWQVAGAGAVTSNESGGFHEADAAAVRRRLARQISAPVKWLENMRAIAGNARSIVELGPGKPLRAFFAAIDVEVTAITSLAAATETFSG